MTTYTCSRCADEPYFAVVTDASPTATAACLTHLTEVIVDAAVTSRSLVVTVSAMDRTGVLA